MADDIKIKQLGTLLKLNVTNYKTTKLHGPGENYGSTIVGIEIDTVDENGILETLNCVIKLCPSNEWTKKMFNIPITFRKEVIFYSCILPLLQNFQMKQGMVRTIKSMVPLCLGCRLSLEPNSDIVDNDAVILLENLKEIGFTMADRTVGFNYETTKMILQNLAVFHAVPIALKESKPDIFNKRIKKYLEKSFIFELADNVYDKIIEGIIDLTKRDEGCKALDVNIREGMRRGIENKNQLPVSDLFATMSHNDCWVNNFMLKLDNDGMPMGSVMLDFQLIDYHSLANDLIFFLYSSVETCVLDVHYDAFLNIYYLAFLNCLEQLKCSNIKSFTYDLFLEELNEAARNKQFYHIMVMLKPIYTKKCKLVEDGDFNESDLLRDDNLHASYVPKLCKVIKSFAHKGWI